MKVILNSDNRTNLQNENCVWDLTEPIHASTQFRVRQVIVPNTSYSFRASEATLVIGGVNVVVPTNKRYKQMSTFLIDLNASVGAVTIPNVSSLVFAFDEEKGVLKFTHTSSTSFTITANSRFGVPNPVTVNAGTAQVVIFEGIFSLLPYKSLLLSSNSLMTNDVRSSTELGTAFACVPMTGSFGDVVVYQNENAEFLKLNAGTTIYRIHVMLRDEKGVQVDLNEQSWLIELEIL